MGGKLNIFNLGSLGVNIVDSPLHVPDGAWTHAQNAEFPSNLGQGGLKKRGSLTRINSVALAGAVQAIVNAPFPLYTEQDLMVGLNTGDVTNAWKKSTDGTTYTNLLPAVIQRFMNITKSPNNATSCSQAQRAASFQNQFYYPGDDFVVDTTAPPLIVWNGTLSFEQFRIPNNPTSAGPAKWMPDLWIDNGVIYMAVYDPGGAAPDHKGRVLSYDPSNGVLQQVGNRFGNGTGELTAGFPYCLTSYLGYLWAGTYGISGNNLGKVYRIQPGVDDTWTLDLTGTLHNGYYQSLCAYNGKLYAGTDADSSGTAIVQSRTSAGVWGTTLTAPANNVSYFSGLIVFDGNLYCCWYKPGATCLIKKFDGTSWTTDKDIGVDFALKAPGSPFVFNSALYWPFLGSDSSGTSTAGFLAKRTTGGVWTQPLTATAIRGGLGKFIPAPA